MPCMSEVLLNNTRVLFTTSFHTACCVGRNGDGARLGKASESPLLYVSVSAEVLPVLHKPRGSQLIYSSSDAGDTSPVRPGLGLSTRLAHQSFQHIFSWQINSSFYLSVYKLISLLISCFSTERSVRNDTFVKSSFDLCGMLCFQVPGLTLGSV